MEPFTEVAGIVAPMPDANIDTDTIIPARFLRTARDDGYGGFLFHHQRFDADGHEVPDFLLNKEPFRHASFLAAGPNFGCGSSREGAVYALMDFGFRAVIAPSFGDIFFSNALRNGLLPVRLDFADWTAVIDSVTAHPQSAVRVDLTESRVVLSDGTRYEFSVDGFHRRLLLTGQTELSLTLSLADKIERFGRNVRGVTR